MQKFIYVLSQKENTGYNTYDSCVVVATSEEEAKNIPPDGNFGRWSGWCSSPDKVQCTCIGKAKPSMEVGVVVASFNAG